MSGKPEKKDAKAGATRMIAQNRRATYEYHVLDELECGIVLVGTEVKSLRAGRCTLQEAYGLIRAGELWLLKLHIPEYAQGNIHNHEPVRDRKLLAQRRQIEAWHEAAKVKGMTIVPLSLYFVGARVKVRLGLCKGKKLHDKRDSEREKSDRREMDRAMSRKRG